MFRSSFVLALALLSFVTYAKAAATFLGNADETFGPSSLDQDLVERSLLPADNEEGQVYKTGSLRDLEHLPPSSLWGHKYIGGTCGVVQKFGTRRSDHY